MATTASPIESTTPTTVREEASIAASSSAGALLLSSRGDAADRKSAFGGTVGRKRAARRVAGSAARLNVAILTMRGASGRTREARIIPGCARVDALGLASAA